MYSLTEKIMLAVAAFIGVFCLVMGIRKFREAVARRNGGA